MKNVLIKNIGIVLSGTVGAQIISILTVPAITRMYGPEAYGMMGAYLALIQTIAPLASICLPMAMVLPSLDGEAKALGKLSIKFSLFFSVILFFIAYFWGEAVSEMLGLTSIGNYIYFLPFGVLGLVMADVGSNWVIRKQRFIEKRKVSLCSAVFDSAAKLGLGLIYAFPGMLVFISALSGFFQTVLYWHLDRKQVDLNESGETPIYRNRTLLKKYHDFPVYRSPQIFLNALSQSLPVLMLTAVVDLRVAGFYSLARMTLALPSSLLGQAVSSVIYPQLNKIYMAGESIKFLLKKTTISLGIIGIFPFGIVVFLGPTLFSLVFGAEWRAAGEYAAYLSAWLFFGLCNRACVAAIPILKIQDKFLIYEVVSVVARALVLWVGLNSSLDPVMAVGWFSLLGAMQNFALIGYVIQVSGKNIKLRH